jgi:site-specific recombinase XerD
MKTTANFPGLLEAFFIDRLMQQRQASPHTIASYRDTFRLLLAFAQKRLNKPPSKLTFDELDAPFIGAFLNHIEKERGNKARSRNVRLAAIRSFFRYVALHEPSRGASAQRVLAMPSKRFKRKDIHFLTRLETDALVAAPNRGTWGGRRDRALLLLMVQTGLRVSEVTALRCQDIVLGTGAYVRCTGKGRKERNTPLRKETAAVLHTWIKERNGMPAQALFPNARGGRLSTDGVEHLLKKHLATAKRQCPSLGKKHVTPHVLRHTTAMELLQCGVDRAVIALWLGHESVETTQMYLHADLKIKEKALAQTAPLDVPPGRYRPDDELLAFLQGL